MIEGICHCCSWQASNIGLIIQVIRGLMGVCESICLPASDSGELQLVFYEDQAVGQLLGLNKQQKEEYWGKIKESRFYQGVQNRLFPLPGRKDIGLIYFPNKYLYEGGLKEEMPDGVGRAKLFSDKLTVEGTFKDGKVDGQCVFVFSDRKAVIKGRWSKGIPSRLEINSQKRRYTVQFLGERLDQAVVTFANMSQYRGSLRYDPIEKTHIIQGKGTLTYNNGDKLAGNFVNGYLQGEGEFKWGSQRYSYRGSFKRGLFNGKGQCDLGDKGLLKIAWRDNKPKGSGTLTYNGIEYPVYYDNGVRLEKLSSLSE